MSREWKPGDVAMVTAGNRHTPYRAFFDGKTWREVGSALFCVDAPTSLRPLVVIDPEDRDAARHLANAFFTKYGAATGGNRTNAMQAALRSLVTPPKPRCVAHGNETCIDCSRISSDDLDTDGDCKHCSHYGSDGMHWDTCPGRIRGHVYANRDEATGVTP